ncbi:MAG: hypothetical protein D6732_15635 [Methanobacteriota archaeon]|nr:MAG: hypothetical protein D6732_15635 [Euryarchaeota archaeon]
MLTTGIVGFKIKGICISAREKEEYLKIRKYINSLSPDTECFHFSEAIVNPEILDRCDFIFTVGGDGSVAWLVRTFYDSFGTIDTLKPLVPVTRPSSVGYLKQLEFGENKFKEGFQRILNGDFNIHNRTILKVEAFGQQHLAVNEAYAQVNPHLAKFTVEIETGEENRFSAITSTFADGVMISTSIGSTGWTLSHGGYVNLNENALQILTLGGIHSSANFIVPRKKVRVTLDLKNTTITDQALNAYNEARIREGLKPDENPRKTLEILYGSRLVLDGKALSFGVSEFVVDPSITIPFVTLRKHTEIDKVRRLTEIQF